MNVFSANLNNQWKYARLYLIIQFFDADSLLPPPFTFLTLVMYLITSLHNKATLYTVTTSSIVNT